MALAPGQKIGSYEIVAPLGAGGMGEVYRARDSRLKREVAIKVLPDDVASDPERLARFQREAEVLASLNHPHIAHVYGIEGNALVMELVEGEDLSQRIARGAIPIDEALPIARQIAEALEAAHDHGVIHRDLKPANIKVRDDGTVKVLDFGLAKALEQGSGIRDQGSGALANSPTITSPAMTMRGMILGTAAYMAPEQAKGKAVDRRADIWAFGCVLYEMLTGQRTFAGEDVSDTLVSILRDDPRWAALPPGTPAHIRLLLRRCLQRDPQKRLPHIGAARLELADADTGELTKGAPPPPPSRWRVAAAVVAGAAATAVVAYLLWPGGQSGEERIAVRFVIEAPDGTVFPGASNVPRFAVSADGRHIAIQLQDEKQSQLWIRSLDSLDQQPLHSTTGERGGLASQGPFWSPDGRYIAFFDEARGELKKLERSSGLVQVLCKVPGNQYAGTWNDDNDILFSSAATKGVLRIASTGGTATAVTTLDASAQQSGHLWPDFLPDGRRFVYQAVYADDTEPAIFVGSLDGGAPVRLFGSPTMARVVWPDRLMFARNGVLLSQRFDLRQPALIGEPELISRSILQTPSGRLGVSASRTGVIVFPSGGTEGEPFETSWVGRSGAALRDLAPPITLRGLNGVRLSSDGRSLIYARGVSSATGVVVTDLWLQDVTRGIETRLSAGAVSGSAAIFSPDGTQIVFRRSNDADRLELHLQRVSGSVQSEVLFTGAPGEILIPIDWTPDGKQIILFRGARISSERGVWILNLDGDRAPIAYTRARLRFGGALSPDGRFLAYADGSELDDSQIFVQPFPDASAGKWTVSARGATYPRWSRDGKQIFFVDQNRHIVAVPFTAGPRVEFGAAVRLFEVNSGQGSVAATWSNPFDVMPDGKSFVILKPRGNPQTRTQLIVDVRNP